MKFTTGNDVEFEPTELLLAKAIEAVDGAEAANYEHAIRLGGALGGVYAREHERLAAKYGAEHPRTQQAKLRLELAGVARRELSLRFSEVSTAAEPSTGWSVDGYVTAVDGKPAENVTVAIYDRGARRLKEFPTSATDKNGFFGIAVAKIPESESPVFVWASLGEKLLKSNRNVLAPSVGGKEHIKIVLVEESRDVYKTTPNVKINLSHIRDEAPSTEANSDDFKSGDEPPTE